MDAPLFGILIVDRDPIGFQHFAGLLQSWVQIAGGCGFLGLAVYLFTAVRGGGDSESNKIRRPVTGLMLGMFVVALLLYAVFFVLLLSGKGPHPQSVRPENYDPNAFQKYQPPQLSWNLQPLVSTLAGLAAIVGIGQPFVTDLLKVRGRRLWALANLAFKEAIRSRVFYVFLVFFLPFVLPVNWFMTLKPEDELRTSVRVTAFLMEALVLVSAALLSSFSIPNDIKNQNMYTVVTKPVERFEIALGRFIGYSILLTAAMAAMVAANLAFIAFSNIDEKAKEETFKARVPHRGTLSFAARTGAKEGTNVGREFDYRKYIPGAPITSERAIWAFADVPAGLTVGDKQAVACEFSFDIFRLTKGEENRGVNVNIRVVSWQAEQAPPVERGVGTWRWADEKRGREYLTDAATQLALTKELEQAKEVGGEQWAKLHDAVQAKLARAVPGTDDWGKVNELAEKHGFYEYSSKEVYDFHPDSIPVPVGLFANARGGDPGADKEGNRKPRVQVYVQCTSGGQMLGMADADLYILEGTQPFEVNFVKAAVGLWCRVLIVVALAVSLSTYLVGIITLLGTAFVYICAYFAEHIKDVAEGTSTGGGPFQALHRSLTAQTATAPIDQSVAGKTAIGLDTPAAWAFRQMLTVIPDVEAFTWTNYLKEGFNVSGEYLVMNVVVMVGYVLPWMVLSYYLLRNREVAA
jgi:ABC-type transport system involved in multi-copper enzyme maturation permease subunit